MRRLPPHAYFAVSAVFHYLGPAFAVLLFVRVGPLGTAWLRIAAAAACSWPGGGRGRCCATARCSSSARVLALMNCCFYLAIDRLPLATVAAIEFLPVIALAALGARTGRNAARAPARGRRRLRAHGDPARGRAARAGLAFANAALFALYIVLGHRVAQGSGLDGLAASMVAALVVVTPLAFWDAVPALDDPVAIAAGHRRRRRVVGDPVRLRPARDGAAAARDLRAARLAPARDGDRDRRVVLAQVPSPVEVLGVSSWWRGWRCTARAPRPAATPDPAPARPAAPSVAASSPAPTAGPASPAASRSAP